MLASRRFQIGTAIRQAAIWLGVALILVTVYSYRFEFAGLAGRVFGELIPGLPVASTNASGDHGRDAGAATPAAISVRAGSINGASARFLIDTGASVMTLTPATAAAAGFSSDGPHLHGSRRNGQWPCLHGPRYRRSPSK